MNLDRLYDILNETTIMFRIGPERVDQRAGERMVTHIYAMPHISSCPAGWRQIDVVFMIIGVDPAQAEVHRAELLEILATYPQPERLAGGPNYMEVGAVVDDQGTALRLFALGEVLGLWQVITPRTLSFTDETTIRELAGNGLLMISGWKPR